MKVAFVLVICMVLAGCAAPRVSVQEVKVAVPIKCQAEVPTRPAMPTATITADLPDDRYIFEFVKSAAAEIELRDGYEGRLLTALESCL